MATAAQVSLAMDVMIHSSNFLLPNPAAAAAADDNINGLTSPPTKYALIILNQRLPRLTPLLWSHAQLRVCADGGANRLFDELPQFFPQDDALAVRKKYKPDAIKGDMDSVRDEVVDFYSNLGTTIVDASDDQDTTDLHKCVVYIHDLPDPQKSNVSLVFWNRVLLEFSDCGMKFVKLELLY